MASYRTLAAGLFAASAAVAKPIPNEPPTESTPTILVATSFVTSVTLTDQPWPTHVQLERALPPGGWARTSPSVSSKSNTQTVVVSRFPDAQSIIPDWLPDWGDNTHSKRHIALATPEPRPDWHRSNWRPAPFEDEDSVWPQEDVELSQPQEQFEPTSQASPEQAAGSEEQVEDFVLLVPEDQSKGAPYLVPANEYDGPLPDADSSEWHEHTWPAPEPTGVEPVAQPETTGQPETPPQLEVPHEPVPAPIPEALPAPEHAPGPVPASEPVPAAAAAAPVPIVEPIPAPEGNAAPTPGLAPISEVGPAPQAAPISEVPSIPDIRPNPEVAPAPGPVPAPEPVAAPLPEPHAPHPAPVPDLALAAQPHVEPHPPAPAAAAPAPGPPAPVAPAPGAPHPPQPAGEPQPPAATPWGTLPEWFPDESAHLLERNFAEGQVPNIFEPPKIWENSKELRKEAQAPYAEHPDPDPSHSNGKDEYQEEDTQDPEEDIQEPEEDIQDPVENIQDAEGDSQDPEEGIQDPKEDIQGSEKDTQDPEEDTQNPEEDPQDSNQAPVCDPLKERCGPAEGYEQPVGHYYPGPQYGPANGYVPEQGCDPEKGECASEGRYDPGRQYAPEQQHKPESQYLPEKHCVPEQQHAPEKQHAPAQQYAPKQQYVPGKQYAPEPYITEQLYSPEQQRTPKTEYAPEQEYTFDQQHAPEEQYAPEQQYIPEEPCNQGQPCLPKQQYAPEEEYAPGQHYDPEQMHEAEQHEIPQAPLYPAFSSESSPSPEYNDDPANDGKSDPACNDCGYERNPPPHFAAGPQPHHIPGPLQKSQASPFIGLDRPTFESPALEQPSEAEQPPVGFDPNSVIFGPSTGEPQQNYDQGPYPYPVYDDNTWTYGDHANHHPYWPQGQSPHRHDLSYSVPYQYGQRPNECVCEQGYQPCSYTGPGETYYTLPYEAPRHLRQSDHCCPGSADRPSHEGSYETYDKGPQPYVCPYYDARVPYQHYNVEYHPPSYSSPPSGPVPYEYIPEGYHEPKYPGYGYFHPGGSGSQVIPLGTPNYECIQRRPLREGIYSPQGFDPTDRRSMPRWMY